MELKQYERGQLVKSTAGHDKGIVAVIIAVESEEYVLLADGKTRPVNKPKRKKPTGRSGTESNSYLNKIGG